MILVTGGAGFIGSVLVKELNRKGHTNIVIVDRLRDTSKWLNLRGLSYYQYLHSDELFTRERKYIFNDITAIFHIGACSATTEMDMDYLMQNNVEYSKRLIRIATKNDIPIIYASSAATYGGGEFGYSDEHSKIDNFLPLNPYGYSKQLVDQWMLSRRRRPKIWFGLKFFNVYGPNEYHKESMRSLIHKAVGQIKESGEVKLFKSHQPDYEDGEQLRDFVYVCDVAKAMVKMLEVTNSKHSGIYNIGTGHANSFNDLVKATFQAMDVPVNIKYIDMPQELREQYQYYTQADMTKFHKLFPNFAFSSLKDGVCDYVQNYILKSNPNY